MSVKYYECIMAEECEEKSCPHNWLHYYSEECEKSFCEVAEQEIGCISIEEAMTIPLESEVAWG